MRAAYGRRAIEAGVPERDEDRADAVGTITNVLHWVHQREAADPESVLEMALHHFVIERAGAYGWERITAISIEDGERIAPDKDDRPDGEGSARRRSRDARPRKSEAHLRGRRGRARRTAV